MGVGWSKGGYKKRKHEEGEMECKTFSCMISLTFRVHHDWTWEESYDYKSYLPNNASICERRGENMGILEIWLHEVIKLVIYVHACSNTAIQGYITLVNKKCIYISL